MKKTISALLALLGPLFLIIVLAHISYTIEGYTSVSFNPYPRMIWYLASGVLVALYLAVLLVLCPRQFGPALVPCSILGAISALALCVLETSSFAAVMDYLPFSVRFPVRLEGFTVLHLTGVTIAGNVLCAIRASHGRNEMGRRLNE